MESLPCELLEYILSFLPLYSLMQCWELNYQIRDVIMAAPFLKNITLEQILELVNKNGQSNFANYLVDLPDLNPNKTVQGETFLHFLTHQEKVDCIKTLMKNKQLKVNMKDKWGKTALHRACKVGKEEVMKVLLE